MGPNKTLPALSERMANPAGFLSPIEFLREDHERQRWFCEQLVALTDDIWQSGHEKLAASLSDFAIVDIANNSKDESELLAPALLRCCVSEAGPGDVVADMVRRHKGVAVLATPIVDGLDLLASGKVPSSPTQFIVSALQLVEILNRNLDWADQVLLPLAASRLTDADQTDLGSAMARRYGVPYAVDDNQVTRWSASHEGPGNSSVRDKPPAPADRPNRSQPQAPGSKAFRTS